MQLNRMIYPAHFPALGGVGGMSYYVYVALNCHNRKIKWLSLHRYAFYFYLRMVAYCVFYQIFMTKHKTTFVLWGPIHITSSLDYAQTCLHIIQLTRWSEISAHTKGIFIKLSDKLRQVVEKRIQTIMIMTMAGMLIIIVTTVAIIMTFASPLAIHFVCVWVT